MNERRVGAALLLPLLLQCSRLLGPVTAAVVRLPGASRTRDAMDEEGERASWLLLSRAFARCFVRASEPIH